MGLPLRWTPIASLTRKGLLNRLPVKHAFRTLYAPQRGDQVGEGGGDLGRSDSTGFNNRESESRTMVLFPTVRFLIAVQLVGKPQPTEWQHIGN
jgi:hypothetical protein